MEWVDHTAVPVDHATLDNGVAPPAPYAADDNAANDAATADYPRAAVNDGHHDGALVDDHRDAAGDDDDDDRDDDDRRPL